MQSTTSDPEIDTDSTETSNCERDWCGGPESSTLPCFSCFDSEREYDVEGGE